MTLEGIEAVKRKALGVVFSLADFHLAASTFFHLDGDGSHHCLTGIFVGACLTVVEDVPLAVDFANRAVGIAVRNGRGNDVALLVFLASTTIDDGAAREHDHR